MSKLLGFLNLILLEDEWENCLPRSNGDDGEIPSEHLIEFHECMHQLGIVHEYLLMKMFRYSLEGNAQEWCRYLPFSSIYSMKELHISFYNHYRRYFPHAILFEDYYQEFKSYLQHKLDDSSSNVDERKFSIEKVDA